MAKRFDEGTFLQDMAEGLKTAVRAPNIRKYSPHQRQYEFHCSYCRGILYIGGNRSGKTTGGVAEGIWRASCTHPYRPELNAIGPNRGRVVGVDFTYGVEKILLPQYKQWCPPSYLRGGSWDSAYDKSTRTLNFLNGSTIEFMSYDQDLDKFAGTSRHWIHFDEEPPKTIFTECMARLVDTNGEYWITMTPVEGMTWIFEDLYEPNVGLPVEEQRVRIIEINMLENPYLSEEGVKQFAQHIDGDDVSVRIGGGFVVKGGRIYKNFDPTVGGPHVLKEPIDFPREAFNNCLWILGLDHGLNNPTAVVWIAVDPNGFAVQFDEHYRNEWTVKQHADAIKQKIRLHGRFPDLLVADPSIVNRSAIDLVSVQLEYQKYGLSFIAGNNDKKAGIIRVKRFLQTDKYVGKRRTDSFSGDAFPRFRVTPNCVMTIKEMKGYRWKTYTDKKKQFENNPYDEPHDKDNHTCDAVRYALMTQPDLAAATVDHDLDRIMSLLDQKTVMATDPNYDDPRNLLDPDNPWTIGNDKPPVESGDWEFDEHMGIQY